MPSGQRPSGLRTRVLVRCSLGLLLFTNVSQVFDEYRTVRVLRVKTEIDLEKAKLALINRVDGQDSAIEALLEAEELVAERKKKIESPTN